jgi:hypothetical protein
MPYALTQASGLKRSAPQPSSNHGSLLYANNFEVDTLCKKVYTFEKIKKGETFEKGSILSKVKEDENFNHRNTFSISRSKI